MSKRKRQEPQVILYKSWLAMFLALNTEQNGEILDAISKHVILGVDVEVSEEIEPLVANIRAEIDVNMAAYTDKCETNKRIADNREEAKRTNVQRTCNERDTNVTPKAHHINTNTNTNINITDTNVSVLVKGDKNSRFIPPTVDEVRAYCEERKNGIDAEEFVAHYETNGWYRGKTKIKNWKSAVITWEKNRKNNPQPQSMLDVIANFNGGDEIGNY